MTRADLNRLVRAWEAWDEHSGDRNRVVNLEDALRPIAAHLDTTNSRLRDHITDHRRQGRTVTVALRHIIADLDQIPAA